VEVPELGGFGADGSANRETALRAADAWRTGGLVALPTETVYGLAADAQDEAAVARIYQVKGRPADHPLIVHVADRAAIAAWSRSSNAIADVLAAAFWPGPLTLVVPRGARAGDHITGGQDTVALRSPGHPVALACLRALGDMCGDPARGVAAPSANRFGRVSPTSARDVVAEVGERLDPARDLVVDGGACAVGLESTIVDCTAVVAGVARPRVLRPGAISQGQIDAALAEPEAVGVRVEGGLAPPPTTGGSESNAPRAPGMLESHYAPAARVIVLPTDAAPATAQLATPALAGLVALAHVVTPPGWVRLAEPRTVEQYAHDLYAALRRADVLGLDEVVAVLPPTGAGALTEAVADRLGRAAHL
jgi:L-threonylcarbamoyladenylate synthase